jgi:hypothetical protein
MKNRFTLLYIASTLCAVFFSSCEKVIEVDIKESASQVVIEGNITNEEGAQFIRLSRSVSYTEPNTYPAITGAVITVSNNRNEVVNLFKEVSPGVYAAVMRGAPGVTYTMNASFNGEQFTANSTMPQPVPLDSLSISKISFGGEDRKVIAVHYTDPKYVANQYRFITKINGTQTRRVYASNDRLTDGNEVKDLLYYSSDDDNEEINKDDKIEVEMQCIDEAIYKYWITLADQGRNGPGGGTTPGNPPTNISNNALGYFSAHTVSRLSTVITE